MLRRLRVIDLHGWSEVLMAAACCRRHATCLRCFLCFCMLHACLIFARFTPPIITRYFSYDGFDILLLRCFDACFCLPLERYASAALLPPPRYFATLHATPL